MTANTQYRKIKIGDLVKLKSPIQTKGGTLFAKGLTMKVYRKWKGLGLVTINNRPCKTCGVGQIHRIEQVPASDVTPVQKKSRKKTSRILWNHARAGLG